jgi:hypothetical protein
MSGSFRRSVTVFVNENLSPAAQSAHLARTAIAGREELIRTRRAPDSYRTLVDGKEGVPEAQVQPRGMIVYRFNLLGEAAAFALAFLRARSPVKSGAFRDNFWLAVDGRPFSIKTFDPEKVGGASEIIIYNLQPYSRRVQVQFDGTRRLRFSVPPDMFGDAMVAVAPLPDVGCLAALSDPRTKSLRAEERAPGRQGGGQPGAGHWGEGLEAISPVATDPRLFFSGAGVDCPRKG